MMISRFGLGVLLFSLAWAPAAVLANEGGSSAAACDQSDPVAAKANPCCYKNYLCIDSQPSDAAATFLPTGSATSASYKPLRFILKMDKLEGKKSSKDQSVLKDAPEGALYRLARVEELSASPRYKPTECLSLVQYGVQKVIQPKTPGEREVIAYVISNPSGKMRKLFGLVKDGLDTQSQDIVQVREGEAGGDAKYVCGERSDLRPVPMLERVKAAEAIALSPHTSALGMTLLTLDQDHYAKFWQGTRPIMTFGDVMQAGLNTQIQSQDDVVAIFIGVSMITWVGRYGMMGQTHPTLGSPPPPATAARDYLGIHGGIKELF